MRIASIFVFLLLVQFLAAETKEHEHTAKQLCDSGIVMARDQFKYCESLEVFFKSLDKCEDDNCRARALNCIGVINVELGLNEDAVPYLLESIKLSEMNKDTAKLYLAYKNIFNAYSGMKLWGLALKYLNRALKIAHYQNDTLNIIDLTNNKGLFYYDKGNIDTAAYYFNKVLPLTSQNKHRWQYQNIINNLAIVDVSKGKIDSALEKWSNILRLQIEDKEIENIGIGYFNLAKLYHQHIDIDSAMILLDSAEKYSVQANDHDMIMMIYDNKYQIFKRKGMLYEALSFLEKYNVELNNKNNKEITSKLKREEVRLKIEKRKIELENRLQEERYFYWTIIVLVIILILLVSVLLLYVIKLRKQRKINESIELLENLPKFKTKE